MLIFAILLTGYVFWRAVLPLSLPPGRKAVLTAALAAAAFKFHLLHLAGGPMFFAPALPGPVLAVSAWLFATLFLFFFLLLGADLLRGAYLAALFCRGRKRPEKFREVSNRINLALLLFALLLSGAGIAAGTSLPRVREQEVRIKNLPPEADGISIAVLADLHADALTGRKRIREIVDRTNALSPDLIVAVGDFVDGTVAGRGPDLEPLGGLSARLGVFGVPGNHEYYSGYDEWIPFLSGLGIEMLENSSRLLPEVRITVSGVTDPAALRFGRAAPDPAGAAAGLPPDAFRLLLSHQPKLAREAERAGFDLQISGHTHGGMILGVDALVARFNAGFVSGLYRVGNLTLYVTNGSGIWNGFPVRLGVPSEITLLRLRRE